MSGVVLVHGAFHELWGPARLAHRWTPSLLDGLWSAGVDLDRIEPADVRRTVRIGFWGDIFRPSPEVIEGAAPSDDLVAQVEADGAGAIGTVSADLARRIHARTLEQLGTYFADSEGRARVHDRILAVLGPRNRVVVAHSLGTVITYEVLRRHPEIRVDEFVTLGSPLGEEFVRAAIQPPLEENSLWPRGVEQWTNVSAEGDLATAAAPRLAPLYGDRIVDEFVFNGTHPHDIEPYLTTPAVGRPVARGLGLTIGAR